MRTAIGALALALFVGGCQGHTLGGAALGGLGGAYAGSKIGQGQGNLIATGAGTLVGAGIGGYLGSFFDQSNRNAASIQQLQQNNNVPQQSMYYQSAPVMYGVPPQYGYQGQSVPMNCTVQQNYVVCNTR
jgi:uncharacterized protein YcfJ